MQPPESQNIIMRFYQVIDALIAHKVLRGRQTFCNAHNINKRNFYTQKDDLDREYFKVNWLIPLVQDYGVNANWLLTGRGRIFTSKSITGEILTHITIKENVTLNKQ